MINKYLNKLNADIEYTDWNPKIKNLDGSPFPEIITDKLEIKPENAKSEYVLFYNRNHPSCVKQVKYNSNLEPEWLLPVETHKVLTLWLNHLLKTNKNNVTKNALHRVMCVLTTSKKQFFEFTQSDYDELISPLISKLSGRNFNAFISYCVELGYCELIRTRAVSYWDDKKTGKRRKEKLPRESSIIALGDIFCQVIPQDKSLWDTSVNTNQASPLMSTFTALCLGSPNRMEAEVITLQKQTLTHYNSQDDDNVIPLNSLFWQGSKCFKDNEKHIGSWMVEPLERAFSYFDRVTAPYRVLANFWINQQSTIEALFADISLYFEMQLKNDELSKDEMPEFVQRIDERLKTAGLSKQDVPNFIQLGYLLGFYESDTFMLNTRGKLAHKKISEPTLPVHISEIRSDFKVFSNRRGGMGKLLGFDNIKDSTAIVAQTDLKMNEFVTIGELQQYQFESMTKDWPSFPLLKVGEDQNEVHIRDAMWVLTGAAIGGMGGYYTLIQSGTIASMIDKFITKGRLWTQHGFSIRLRVTPHQLRHYINHNGYINDIPEYILNKWSGRADSKHLVHYVHEEEEDRLVRIPKVTRQIKLDSIQIVDESEKGFAELRGLVKGATSRTSTGFCIKDVRYSPCNYLSRFETQCTFCEHSCHVAHDKKGIDVLKEDYAIQQRAMNEYIQSPKKNLENRSNWFKIQKANTYLLSQLIDVLEDKSIRAGSVVRVITENQDIRIADLKTKSVTFRKLQLDVMDKDIEEGLKLLNFVEEKTNRDKVTDAFLEDLWGAL
ncbi:TPA: hypothetical protein KD866_000858 [Vibrio parahaemolyticus]|nr:hypothetical protein [Vibrio parahaemolyticus]